jgi:hypothetical protein
VACTPGLVQCGAACVATRTDSTNCGGCGIQCGSGAVCFRGACSPPVVSTQIATGLTDPLDIAVDGDSVYWTDPTAQTVSRMPKGGGAIQPLASGQAEPQYLAIDSSYVYWTATLGGGIWRAPKDVSSPASLFATAYDPHSIAVAGGQVYWTNTESDPTGNFTLERVPTTGGTPEILDSNRYMVPWWDVASNGTVVVVGGNVAERIDGTSIPVLSNDLSGVATDATSYYVSYGTTGRSTFRYDYNNTPIESLGGYSGGDLGTCQGVCMITFGAGDSCAVYVLGTFNDGTQNYHGIIMAPHHGPTTLLVPVSTATATIRSIATDGDYVYWADSRGFIGRLAIP